MKYWGGRTPPSWVREIAQDRPRPLVAAQPLEILPMRGDIVLKPFIDHGSYRQLFRLETWETHDLLDGPFDDVHRALESALEFGVTSRLAVWLDYSDHPGSHELDTVPLYSHDTTCSDSKSVA